MSGLAGRRLFEVLLLILVIAAVVWVASLLRQKPAAPAAPEIALAADFGTVAGIEIVRGGDTLALVRRGEEYWIERPLHDRADPFLVEELLRQARRLRAERALPDTAGEAYGLEPARDGVFLRSSSGRVWGVWLGDETPVGGQKYARRAEPGSPIVLVESFTTAKYLLPAWPEIRDPVAVSLRAGPPDSVAVLVPGRELRARRSASDRWLAREPRGLDLDAARIDAVVQLLRGPNLIEFPPPDLGDEAMGLALPRATWVVYQGARRESVRVGRASPDLRGIYVRPARRSLAALLSAEQYRALVDGWPGLADRRLLTLSADSIRSVDFLGGTAGGYRRDGDRWVRRPGGAEVRRLEALRTDLRNLSLLQWRSWPTREDPPPASARRLRLRIAGTVMAETLHLASTGDSLAWARSTRRPLWGRVPETAWGTWKHRADHAESESRE